MPLYEGQEWNYNGTADWEFINTLVTAVVDEKGSIDVNSPLLGSRVFGNEKRPFAKIVDIDVDFQVSSIYGLEFGLGIGTTKLFQGRWSPSVIVHDMWSKLKCSPLPHHDAVYGAQSTTKITNIVWHSDESIQKLKAATKCPECTGDLSVSITLSVYSFKSFTVGNVIGTIGVSKIGEPLNVGGERKLETADSGTLQFPSGHPCSDVEQDKNKPWTYGAPFKLDESRGSLVVDLGNALPLQSDNKYLDLGRLWFGVFENGIVSIFGAPIPYLDDSLWNQGGIVEQKVDALAHHSLLRSTCVDLVC